MADRQLELKMTRPFEIKIQLGDEVASYLRDLIVSGQLRGGEYIRMDRVADYLGVSVTPVREALLSLRAEGFVTLEPRKGFIATPLTSKDVTDIFLAQSILAGELAARAASVIDETGIQKLITIQERLCTASSDSEPEAIELENYLFHRTINLLADSSKLAWLLGMAVRYSPRRFYANIEGWPEASIEDHAEILDALKHNDPDWARRTMSAHIVHGGNLLAEFLIGLDKESPRKLPFNL